MAERRSLEHLDRPAYSPVFTGKLLDLHPNRVKRWLRGYSYHAHTSVKTKSIPIKKRPVVNRQGGNDSIYASFLELIDLLFVKNFLNSGISLQKLRRALEEAEHIIGSKHFAERTFFTSGHSIYLEVKEKSGAIKELLSGGAMGNSAYYKTNCYPN